MTPTAPPVAVPSKRPPLRSTVLGGVDLGDDEIQVHEFSDGMFAIRHAGGRTLANAAQMQEIVGLFHGIGKAKGWL